MLKKLILTFAVLLSGMAHADEIAKDFGLSILFKVSSCEYDANGDIQCNPAASKSELASIPLSYCKEYADENVCWGEWSSQLIAGNNTFQALISIGAARSKMDQSVSYWVTATVGDLNGKVEWPVLSVRPAGKKLNDEVGLSGVPTTDEVDSKIEYRTSLDIGP